MSTQPLLAVIIATKNRAAALQKYALPSLEHSTYGHFVCVVWDASDDRETEGVVRNSRWPFSVDYLRASRPGLPSQRNDAVEYVLKTYPSVRYCFFMDDDCALSETALRGVVDIFQKEAPALVNLPMKPIVAPSLGSRMKNSLKNFWGLDRHAATSFLYNYGSDNEPGGVAVEWASGGGMGVDVSLFRDLKVRFPEAFQRFGGYALGEDFAFSYFVFKKLKKKILNSREGYFLHYHEGGARLDLRRMAASKWYNFHLLFNALYDDLRGARLLRLRVQFKVFMGVAALKLLIRARSGDVASVLRGIRDARAALTEFHKTHAIHFLMRKEK